MGISLRLIPLHGNKSSRGNTVGSVSSWLYRAVMRTTNLNGNDLLVPRHNDALYSLKSRDQVLNNASQGWRQAFKSIEIIFDDLL